MSGVWAVLARETNERRSVMLAALAFGLLPLVAGAAAGVARWGGADVRDDLALVVGLAFPLATAVAVGTSVVGRDVAERRLGFYFARPLSGFGIWAGKTLAAALVTLVAALLVWLPWTLSGGRRFLFADSSLLPHGTQVAGAAVVLVLLTAAAQVAGAMVRDRSGLLGYDLGLLLVVGTVYAAAVQRAVERGATAVFASLGPAILASLAAILLAGGAAHVIAGRGDARRGHVALSIVLWGALLVGGGVLHGALAWALAVAPGDPPLAALGRFSLVEPAPAGSFFVTQGASRLGYAPAFVVDVRSGRFLRAEKAEPGVVFTPDGAFAAWLRDGHPRALCTARLDEAPAVIATVSLPRPGDAWVAALAPGGARAVVVENGSVSMLETATGREVAHAAAPGTVQATFEADGHARLYRKLRPVRYSEFVLSDWDPVTGVVSDLGRIEAAAWIEGRSGDRLLVLKRDGLAVADAGSGRVLVGLPSTFVATTARFLEDGRVVAFENADAGERLVVFSADGRRDATIDVGAGRHFVAAETPAGEIVVADATRAAGVAFADPKTGRVRREADLGPASLAFWRMALVAGGRGSLESRLFVDGSGALVDRDPRTGVRRVVMAGSSNH